MVPQKGYLLEAPKRSVKIKKICHSLSLFGIGITRNNTVFFHFLNNINVNNIQQYQIVFI